MTVSTAERMAENAGTSTVKEEVSAAKERVSTGIKEVSTVAEKDMTANAEGTKTTAETAVDTNDLTAAAKTMASPQARADTEKATERE